MLHSQSFFRSIKPYTVEYALKYTPFFYIYNLYSNYYISIIDICLPA